MMLSKLTTEEQYIKKQLGLHTDQEFELQRLHMRAELSDVEDYIMKIMKIKKSPESGTKQFAEFIERRRIIISNCYRKNNDLLPLETYVLQKQEDKTPFYAFLAKKVVKCSKCRTVLEPDKDDQTDKVVYYCEECDKYADEVTESVKENIGIKHLEHSSITIDPAFVNRIKSFGDQFKDLGLIYDRDYTEKTLKEFAFTFNQIKDAKSTILDTYWFKLFLDGKFNHVRMNEIHNILKSKSRDVPEDKYTISLTLSTINESPEIKKQYNVFKSELNVRGIIQCPYLPIKYLALFMWIVKGDQTLASIKKEYKIDMGEFKKIRENLVKNNIIIETSIRAKPQFSEHIKSLIELKPH
jgi:hypothetical protein